MPGDELLTVAEIAERFKLNQETVRNWIDRGELPCVRVRRRVRVRWGTWRRSWNPLGVRPPACVPADRQRRARAFWDAS
jgi:excisionase family DNA binding protein